MFPRAPFLLKSRQTRSSGARIRCVAALHSCLQSRKTRSSGARIRFVIALHSCLQSRKTRSSRARIRCAIALRSCVQSRDIRCGAALHSCVQSCHVRRPLCSVCAHSLCARRARGGSCACVVAKKQSSDRPEILSAAVHPLHHRPRYLFLSCHYPCIHYCQS